MFEDIFIGVSHRVRVMMELSSVQDEIHSE